MIKTHREKPVEKEKQKILKKVLTERKTHDIISELRQAKSAQQNLDK